MNVLLVSDAASFATQADDAALENFLTSNGHTIDADSGAFSNSLPSEAQLADVDVILVSPTTVSSSYASLASGWNALGTPIVLMNESIAINGGWGLINTADLFDNDPAPTNYDFPDAGHPFVDGLSTGFAAGSGFNIDTPDVTGVGDFPNGSTVVATAPVFGFDQPQIVDIPAGAAAFGGGGQFGGRRVFFGTPDYPEHANQNFDDVLSANAQAVLSRILDQVASPASQSLILQAEDAELSGGVAIQSVHPGSFGAYADYPGNTGAAIEWSTPSTPGGAFELSFRYANGDNNASDRPLRLSINGQIVAPSLSFASTGAGPTGWANWTDTGPLEVALSPGVNTIRLESVNPTGPNIDQLRLSGVFNTPPAAPQNLIASGVSATQVNLSWDPTADETGYLIERRDAPGGAFEQIAALPADATRFSDLRLAPGTTYTYRVIADRDGARSDFSNAGDATTLAVTVTPGVDLIVPGAGATDVLRDAILSASLITPNGGILASSLTSGAVLLYPTGDPSSSVELAVQTSGGGDTLQINPTDDLAANTAYTIEVTAGVTDPSGAPFTPFTSSFTTGEGFSPTDDSIRFERVELLDEAFSVVTIGPDGRLYAGRITGEIARFEILSDGSLGPAEELTTLVDANGGAPRALIGLDFDPGSTADNLVLWATHSSFFNNTSNFQGKLTRLRGPDLDDVDDALVGLPRSVRDHLTNQIDFGPDGALYFLQGSNSANGAPDPAWGQREENLLSAALLRFDPALYDFETNGPLDVHTEDADPYDPFAAEAPLTLYATGIRNAYDLVWHSNGQLYVPTNANGGQGNTPDQPGPGDAPPTGLTPRIDQAVNGPFIPPQQVDGIIGTGPTNDFLFRVEEGGYYGHPNPTRNEFIQDGGNPTAGVDPAEFTRYPVGVQPDRNYRGPAFDFGARISPNGVIEYQYDGFGGALQNKLIVARYSNGDDLIVLDPSGPDGAIINSNDAIASFDDLTDPLDLVENPANGNLYVAGLTRAGGFSGTLYLLKPIEVEVPTPEETYYFSQVVSAGAGNPLRVALENTTTETLIIGQDDVSVAGADASQFSIEGAGLPLSVPPGGVFQLDVLFDPSSNGVKTAQLRVDAGDAVLTTELRGVGHSSFQGNGEPPLATILDLYEITTDVGFSSLIRPAGDLLGEEVEMQLLRKASTGPVVIEPIATFGPANDPDYRFGWYTPGETPDERFLFDAETLDPVAGGDGQTVNVVVQDGGTTEFDPGSQPFGLFGEYFPGIGTVRAYTQDELNQDAVFNGEKKYRFYPLKGAGGGVEPNAFVVAVEESTNNDFNDAVFIVRNVVGADLLPGDYNDDNQVDVANFTVWRDNLGTAAELPNDFTPGGVTVDDYLVWRDNFGESLAGAGVAAAQDGTRPGGDHPAPATATAVIDPTNREAPQPLGLAGPFLTTLQEAGATGHEPFGATEAAFFSSVASEWEMSRDLSREAARRRVDDDLFAGGQSQQSQDHAPISERGLERPSENGDAKAAAEITDKAFESIIDRDWFSGV